MRIVIAFAAVALIAVLITPAITMPVWAADEAAAPGLAQTPSGTGDPGALVCRAPQPLPGSEAMGPKICMHNNVWARLTMTGQDLSADGKSVFARTTVVDPTGEGDPDAVTCRAPVQLTASRTRHGPEVCLTNRYWKDLAANHKAIDTNGQLVSTRPSGPVSLGPIPFAIVERSPPL